MPMGSREASLGVGLATAALVFVMYQNALPAQAEVRVNAADDADLSAVERATTVKAAILVGGIALISRDATVLAIGSLAVIFEAWTHRYNNAYSSGLGRAVTPGSRQVNQMRAEAAGTGYAPG